MSNQPTSSDRCSDCGGSKGEQDYRCGGPVCARCPHGAMIYVQGVSKSGRPYWAYRCLHRPLPTEERCPQRYLQCPLIVLPELEFSQKCQHGPLVYRTELTRDGRTYRALFCRKNICPVYQI